MLFNTSRQELVWFFFRYEKPLGNKVKVLVAERGQNWTYIESIPEILKKRVIRTRNCS